MKNIIGLMGFLRMYLEAYCSFRDFVLRELTFEFVTDVKPVVYAFSIGVFVFTPVVEKKEDLYVVRVIPHLISDSPLNNELLRFFENFSEARVRKELYVLTMNFSEAERMREYIVEKMKRISEAITSGGS